MMKNEWKIVIRVFSVHWHLIQKKDQKFQTSCTRNMTTNLWLSCFLILPRAFVLLPSACELLSSKVTFCRELIFEHSAKAPSTRHGDFSLPTAVMALGKNFAECPIKGSRQRGLCRENFYRYLFAKSSSRQRLRQELSAKLLFPVVYAHDTLMSTGF